MNSKPIIIFAGEPKSVFFEIYFKSLKKINIKSPIILVASKKLLEFNMKKHNIKKDILTLNPKLKNQKLNNNKINIINIELNDKWSFRDQDNFSHEYVKKGFEVSIQLLKSGYTNKFINGPISKKFLKKKFLGVTEYLSDQFKIKSFAMLIFNKNLSVCPLTTHLPIKMVAKEVTRKQILEKVKLINKFYLDRFKFKPKIALTGLNPHCESIDDFNEDIKIIKPAINYLKKLKYKVFGPFSSDTIFMKSNRKKYNVILGMYHDQVLTPLKSIYAFDAINITLGLPFLRVTQDHGPNKSMFGKNLSDPLSLIRCLEFLDN